MLKGINEDGELVNLRVTKNGELLVKMSGGTDTSDATAIAEDILQGKTAYVKSEKVEGTMQNNGQLNYTPSTSQQTIPAGYSTGGTINAVDSNIDSNIQPGNIKKDISILGVTGTLEEGIDTSDANATANDIAAGKTAYVNGQKINGMVFDGRGFSINPVENIIELGGTLNIIGKMPDNPQIVDSTCQCVTTLEFSDVANAINLTADKIVSGNNILGIQGTSEPGIDTSDADATANDIVGGKTAYVNGQKIEGTITEHPQDNGTVLDQLDPLDPEYLAITFPDNNESHVFRPRSVINIPKSVLATTIGLTADKIKSGETILGITGTYTGETEG